MKPSDLAKKKREKEGVQEYQRNTYTPPDGFYETYKAATKKEDDWRKAAIERLTPVALTPPTKSGPTYLEKLAENRANAQKLSARVPATASVPDNIRELIFGKPIEAGTVNPRISAADFSTRYDGMTDREKAVYSHLKNTNAKDADKYLKAIDMDINQRNAEKRVADARKIAEENTAAGLYARFMGNNVVSNGAASAYELWQGLRNQPVDPNHPLLAGQDIVKGQNEAFVGDSTGIERYLREGAMGAFDFGTNLMTAGAAGLRGQALQNMVKGSFAAQAFAGSARDAAEREGTGMQSVLTGTASAALATIIEGVGLDRLAEIGKLANARGVLKSMARSIIPEAAEEAVEEAGNILADAVIMGDKNEIVNLYNTARANGATQNDAMMGALGAAGKQIGESAIIGGISGGMIGGGVAMTNRALGGNVLEKDVPDTNVGTTEPTANPSVTPQSVPHAQMVNPSAEAETQAAERQSKARRIVEDKLFYENGQKAFEEEYQRTGKTDHFDAFHTYYSAGVRGVKEADIRQNVFTENADKVMLNKAYIAGAMDRSADLEARKKNAGKVAQTVGVFGAVDKLTEGKRNYLDAISKVMGIEIEVEETAPYNGKYENGRMYVAADAESFVGTVSHEMGHIIRQVVPESYADIEQLVFSRLEKMDGKSYAERLAEYDAKLNRTEGVGRGGYSEAALAEEMICDGLQAIIQSEADAAEFFRSMEQKSPGVLQKLKAFLEDMLQKLRELIGNEAYKEIATDLRQDEAFVKELREAVAKAAVEVGKAEPRKQSQKQAAKTDADVIEAVGAQIDAETQSAAPKMSLRTWNESDYAKDKKKAAQALAKALKIDVEKAEKWIKDINSVAKIIADDRERLDYEANLDDSATVLKSNQEYKWTLDMSTLCAKRLWFTGTFDAIQKAMPDTAFTSEEITRIRTMMMEKGYEVACGICYVESTRREIGPITQMFIDQYKKAQKSGKPIARVNSSGKEVELTQKGDKAKRFYAEKGYTPTLADLNTTDIDLVKRDHPEVYAAYLSFMNARGQAKPKLLETRAEYKGEIAKTFRTKDSVKSRNDAGGLRVQSFSDFEVPHMIDMMQAVMDMSKVGLQAQAYTKVPEFAAVFGGTGMKINLSLIAKGDGVDAKGNLIFDDVEGIPHKKAFKLREKYSENVGTILVGKNDRHIVAAMADPRIDYIIPFHKSSWKESLYEALGLTGYGDYTATQNEKYIDPSRGKAKNFDPSEYWDFTKSGDENAQIYLDKCRKDGRIPKFPEFSMYPGYWKLLIDFKMYDNDGNGSPQMKVRPEFNMTEARKILKAYKGGHRSFPVAQDVVDEFVAEKQGAKFSMREAVEERRDLIAVHNITEDKLRKMIELDGIPMPSIAVMKSEAKHGFGEITMLFRKETIDPKVKGNKVYGADAWTATFPQVGYEMDERLVEEMDLYLGSLITNFTGEEYISRWVRKDLLYSGRKPEQSARSLSRKDDLKYAYWAAKGMTPKQALKQVMGEDAEEFTQKREILDALAWNTKDRDVEAWLLDHMNRTVKRRGVRNNKDLFTPSGNRRSFKALHDDLTAANVVKAMKKQDSALDSYGLSVNLLKAALGEKFKSMKAIKMAEGSLLDSQNQEKEAWSEVNNNYRYLMDRIREGAGDDLWWDIKHEAEAALLQQAKGKYTAESIKNALDRVNIHIEQDLAEEIVQMYDDLKALPVLYFEAKPERVVSFDEVAAVFIPEEMNEALKKRVYGMFGDVVEYQTDHDWGKNNRVEKINEFADELGDVKFSARDKRDAEYLEAVNKHDMKKAQAMVDAAAEEAMSDSVVRDKTGKLIKVYHGTEERFTVFRDRNDGANAVYFSPWESFAEDYGETKAYYVDLRNPVHYDEDFEVINDVDEDDADGFIYLIDAMYDYDEIDQEVVGDTEIGVFDARRIKSADAVVYDDRGDVIPLSQRFNMDSKDIRYSVRESGEAELRRENRTLRAENEHLQKLNENLKRQFKLTDGKTPDPKAVRRVAKGWLKQIQSKADLDDFSMKLGKVAEYFAKAKTDHENDQAMAALRVLVRDAMEEAETLNTEMRDNYSDLIGYIKRTTLKVSDDLKRELEHYGGYNNFRRERFGSMKLSTESGSSIDGFYYSLCQEYPEFFKEEDAADEAEQLMNIAAVLDTLKPVAENPYGYYIDEYVEDEAAGLLNMITDIEMEQTFADKKKAEKIAALKKLKAEFNSTIRQMRKEAKEAQEAAVKKAVYDTQTVERMYHYRLTVDYLAKLDRLRLRQKKMRDTRKRREYRQSLEKRAKDLLKRLKGDDKRPIPEEMRAGVEALLTGFSTDRNDTITILQKDVVRVQKAYEAAGNTDEGLDFDDDTKALLDEFAQVFVTKYGARVHLDDLLTEEMKMLRDIVRNLQHIISNANKLKALEKSVEVAAVGDAFLAENGGRKIVAQAGVLRQIGDFFNLDMLDAISFFKRMGDAAYNYIYKGFRNGLDRKITHVKEAVDFMNELVDEKTVKKWRGEKPKKFELTQGEIWLDIPQKMSLYCLMRREQAKLHMYAGGIKADLDRAALRKGKAAAEALKQYTGIMVTEADLNVIVDTLTAEQKKVAEAMQDFMSDNVAGWGNETSMLMFGYKKFTEKNYFPIVSDKDYINTIAGKDENVTQSLRSLGFTKKTLDTANNPIMIQDIFSVFAKHVDQMSSYNAFVPATSDTNKFLNYKGKITDSGKEDNVKTVLRRIMGDKAVGYIHKLVDTINGAVSYSDEGYLPKMLVRNMKISSVGANVRVIIQQPVSILRAGAVIDMKYLLGAMSPSRSDFDLIVKYAPIAQWKMWGNYDVNVGRSIEELTSGQNYYQKMTEWMMAGAGMADKFTWGRIWKACELEVKHKHPDWIGDRFYEAVGERFGQIIDETQVVDSPLHRSQMMRSKGLYTQMVTSFMSEPTKTYNMATNAFVRLRQNPTPENRKQFARTVWYLALNAVAVAAAAGLVDAARDDDDEEWADKWLQAFRGDYSEDMNAKDKVITFLGSNVGSGVNPMNYIPYLRDLWSLIEGYDIKRTDFDWAADIMNWMTRVHKFTTGESEYTLASMLANTAGAFSKLFGIPAKSALRDLNAVKNLTVNHLIGDEEMKYENRKLTYAIGSEKNTGDYVSKMLEAEFSGNRSLATKIYNDMVKAGIDNETINSKISSSQKKLMKNEPEIGEAAEAYRTGNIRGYQKAIDSLTGKGYSESEALSAVKSAYNKMIGEEKEEELTFDTITNGYWEDDGEETAESYDYRMLFNAFMDGKQDDYGTLWQMLKDGGKKDSNIRSSMRTRLKGAYWDAKDSGDYNRAEKARKEFLRLGGKPETLTYR